MPKINTQSATTMQLLYHLSLNFEMEWMWRRASRSVRVRNLIRLGQVRPSFKPWRPRRETQLERKKKVCVKEIILKNLNFKFLFFQGQPSSFKRRRIAAEAPAHIYGAPATNGGQPNVAPEAARARRFPQFTSYRDLTIYETMLRAMSGRTIKFV
jgi:hypothetical protein